MAFRGVGPSRNPLATTPYCGRIRLPLIYCRPLVGDWEAARRSGALGGRASLATADFAAMGTLNEQFAESRKPGKANRQNLAGLGFAGGATVTGENLPAPLPSGDVRLPRW